MKLKIETEVAQSCLTLSDPMGCSLPGPTSMGFSRQEYWSGLPLPSPGICLVGCKSEITRDYVLSLRNYVVSPHSHI